MKLINLYKEWMKKGKMPSLGLCCSVPSTYTDTLDLFEPTAEQENELRLNGKSWAYWGYEGNSTDSSELRCRSFTELRQTVVLLICAMHDEL